MNNIIRGLFGINISGDLIDGKYIYELTEDQYKKILLKLSQFEGIDYIDSFSNDACAFKFYLDNFVFQLEAVIQDNIFKLIVTNAEDNE